MSSSKYIRSAEFTLSVEPQGTHHEYTLIRMKAKGKSGEYMILDYKGLVKLRDAISVRIKVIEEVEVHLKKKRWGLRRD